MAGRATIVGAAGYVGRALVSYLRDRSVEVIEIGRGEALPDRCGDLFYCAGTTADFRTRTFDTIEAHVSLLNHVLSAVNFDTLTYLSSARVYLDAMSGTEDTFLRVDPNDAQYVYNLSKLTGEALCLADQRPSVRALRLSNVYGPGDQSDNFVSSLIADASAGRRLLVRSGRDAAKDYVFLDDVVAAIASVPGHAHSRLLNIASGRRTSNYEVATTVAAAFGVEATFEEPDSFPQFPDLSIDRMRDELAITPVPLEHGLRVTLDAYLR